jgi:asparagine synthase (glutamine-hydrolysing)
VCGICGKLHFDGEQVSSALLKAMADVIQHRGPDDEGFYVSGPVGFGFRRLSIIDLAAGHQPLSNEDGTVWIVFNGEIYNYQELREYLLAKGHTFTTQTDTEVIVHLYEEMGESCVEKLRGMFAFAIWDDRRKFLFLARDRVGIKPLYYWLSDQSIVFGSEIKSILADPDVIPEVVPEMVDRFLTFYFVPGEDTLLRNIHKLPPGCYMAVQDGRVRVRQYWDLVFAVQPQSIETAEQRLLAMMDECVRLHMISDVPIGLLLSGGVDSTAMLGFTAGKTDRPLSSYTLGFSDLPVADERPYARLAAEKYGSQHHEITITAKDFVDFLPRFAWHMEEPVCEPQAIALYYVSRLAKDFVKVLISGEGGDEAFAGYQTYRGILWLERLKCACGPLKGAVSSGLSTLNQLLRSPRLAKYAPLMKLPFEDYYLGRTYTPFSYFNKHFRRLYSPDFIRSVDKDRSLSVIRRYVGKDASTHKLNHMLYLDTKTSLPDDLLLKADKMTMANSIELRVPLLDHKLLEFAASLPENFKVRRFTTKYIAKRALRDRLPKQILRRKKAGFPVPYEVWQRSELKDWIRGILLDRETLSRGYFDKKGLESMIDQNAQGNPLSREILSLVSLELWHRAFLKGNFRAPSHTLLDASKLVGQPSA